jgi:hypothetical protein
MTKRKGFPLTHCRVSLTGLLQCFCFRNAICRFTRTQTGLDVIVGDSSNSISLLSPNVTQAFRKHRRCDKHALSHPYCNDSPTMACERRRSDQRGVVGGVELRDVGRHQRRQIVRSPTARYRFSDVCAQSVFLLLCDLCKYLFCSNNHKNRLCRLKSS